MQRFDHELPPVFAHWQSADILYGLDLQQEAARCSNTLYKGPSMESFWGESKMCQGESRLVVIGHRGCGKNKLTPAHGEIPDPRPSIMENTIASFNMAAINGADFVEFDVQVTKDGCPVIFHDDCIIAADKEEFLLKGISELTVDEFLSIGYQKDAEKAGKVLLRESVDGTLSIWTASVQDSLCTLQDAFEQVSPSVGFNIELKFDDREPVAESEIRRTISAILQVVEKYALERKVYFSSFHPDAVQILRRQHATYPVFFLTDGGTNIYNDPRRNSMEAAIEVCRAGGLQGIVSEVKAILQYPEAVNLVHDAGLCLLTYGELNNMAEAVHKQEELGVDGIIVDHVREVVTESRKRKAETKSATDSILLEPASVESPLLLKAVRA